MLESQPIFDIQSVAFDGGKMSVVYNIAGEQSKKTHVINANRAILRDSLDSQLTDAVIKRITAISS